MASVTLTLTSYAAGVGNFTIYHSAIDPNNIIETNVSLETLIDGYCTEQIYSTYIVQSNTEDCTNSYYINLGPTPTPGPTSTPGVTGTPTPEPTPTATSAFPTPTPSGGTPTNTPLPTATGPVPTPTPTLPPSVYGLNISSGSIDSDSCGNEVITPIYASVDPALWTPNNQAIFTDSALTTRFSGSNLYYHITAENYNAVWSVNNSGVTVVEGATCNDVYSFYVTVPNNLYEDPCQDPASTKVYSMDFDSVVNMQNGDVIYTSPSLTTELRDGWLFAIADTEDGTANKRSFSYSVSSGVNSISLCATPTPVPTSTPTATPFVSYAYYLTTGSTNNTGCFNTVGAITVYSNYPNPDNLVDNESILYTDSGLTTPFDGNDLWYGISLTNGGSATNSAFVYNNTGVVTSTQNCGTPPPTPTPTPIIYQLFRNDGRTIPDTRCFGLTNQTVYTTDASSSAGLQLGDKLYSDSGVTTELSNGLYYGIGDNSGSTPIVRAYYSGSGFGSGEISELVNCSGSVQSVSMSSYHLNFNDVCSDTTPEFLAYYSPDVDPYNLQPGDQLFEDINLSTPFGNNNLYYGPYSGSFAAPVIAYQLYTGSAKATSICPTPTPIPATPTPTPSPTPVAVYTYLLDSGSNNGGTGCYDDTGAYTVYSDRDSYSDLITRGGVVYTDTSFTTPFDGNDQFFGISNQSSSIALMRAFINNNTGLLTSRTLCTGPTPTPTSTATPIPTSTPTATPFVSYQYFLTSGSVTNTECPELVGANAVYSSEPTVGDFTNFSTILYTDSNLTTPFDGNDLYYGIGTVNGGGASNSLFVANTTGVISSKGVCPTPTPTSTPTPTPTPVVYEYYRTAFAYETGGGACGDISAPGAATSVYSTVEYIGDAVETGNSFYLDSGLTQILSGSGIYENFGITDSSTNTRPMFTVNIPEGDTTVQSYALCVNVYSETFYTNTNGWVIGDGGESNSTNACSAISSGYAISGGTIYIIKMNGTSNAYPEVGDKLALDSGSISYNLDDGYYGYEYGGSNYYVRVSGSLGYVTEEDAC